jgi:DNA polymerase-3 subunit epsilon
MKRSDLSNLVVVDTETTGEDPFTHEILSVAFVPLASDKTFEVNIQLIKDASWTAYGLLNFSNFERAWTHSAVEAKDAVARIEKFISDNYSDEICLVGHNVAFDRFFLARLAYRAGVKTIKGISHRTIDTYSLLMALNLLGKIPKSSTSSEEAFKHFGILIPSDQRHTALGDATATKTLFLKLMAELGSTAE